MSRNAGGKQPAVSVTVLREDDAWRAIGRGIASQISRAANMAFVRGRPSNASRPELTILLTSDERSRSLNREYRGKDKAANVLSFPSVAGDGYGYLGDIAIAHGTVLREAKAFGKPPLHHALHLVVHGVLHLLGYDHHAPKEAETMESLEIEILAEMGIPDPYERQGHAR